MTYEQIRQDSTIRVYVSQADAVLAALGFTEHSFPHVTCVAERAGAILDTLGYPEHAVELAKISGFLHDIGNIVNRTDHSQSGGVMAFRILDRLNFDPEDISVIVSAIGHHDEGTGTAVSPVAAALIIADKSDVRRSRVRTPETVQADIHDRVNYSVTRSELTVNKQERVLELNLTVDTQVSSVMEYFEIFMKRMIMCRRAAEKLGLSFRLVINGQQLG